MGINLGRALRNQYLIIGYCLVLASFLAPAVAASSTMLVLVFVLVPLFTFIVRPVYDLHLKAPAYFVLGTLGYWSVGTALLLHGVDPEPDLAFVIAVSVLSGITGLVAYSDGKIAGHIFASGSASLLFLASGNSVSVVCPVFAFIAAQTSAHFVSQISGPKELNSKTAYAALLSGLFMCIGVFGNQLAWTFRGVYPFPNPANAAVFLAVSVIASLAFTLITLRAFEAGLKRARLMRFVEDGQVMYGTSASPRER